MKKDRGNDDDSIKDASADVIVKVNTFLFLI